MTDDPTIELRTVPVGQMMGRYQIVKKLGEGGMGTVYLATDPTLQRNVAIKVLSDNVVRNSDRLRRLEQEAVTVSALNHPNIMTIYEIGESDGSRFIVSEYVDGITLREKIGDLTPNEAVEIAEQIASALGAAHKRGIIHRDIKPENVMVREDGLVKLLDFGLSKLAVKRGFASDSDAETLALVKTEPGMIMGTASYMSPEQARGQEVDSRTDIWSLGVVLYEMVSGRKPFIGETTMDVIASILHEDPEPLPDFITPGIVVVVSRALRKKVDERYETAEDLFNALKSAKSPGHSILGPERSDLGKLAAAKDTSTHAAPVTQRISLVSKRNLAIGISIVLVFVSGVLLYRNYNASKTAISTSGVNRSPAYDLYVRGKVKVTSVNPDDNTAAIKLLEQAVATDPNYAEAWAALAKGYIFRSFNFAPASEQKKLNEDAEVAVEKSLDLNPNLAEGHLARGLVLWTHAKRFPHEQAIQAFKRAIALNPDFDEAHQWLSVVYIHTGLFDEATQEINKTLEINASNSTVRLRMAAVNYYQGRWDDSISVFKTIPPDEFPANLYRMAADSFMHLGRLKEAHALVEDYMKTYPNDEGGNVTSVKAILLVKEGNKTEAEAMIRRAIEIGQGFGHFHHAAYNIAAAYAIMNKPDEAMKWLQNAADDGFPCYPFFEIDHNLDNLHGDRRFVEFLSKGKIQMEKLRALANN